VRLDENDAPTGKGKAGGGMGASIANRSGRGSCHLEI